MRKSMPKHGINLLWSGRQISLYISWAMIGYVTYFCSDFLGLNTAIVGTLILVSKVVDAISNFVIAYIVDNTHSKFGKGRPWDINIIPLWISLVIIFCIPASWGTKAGGIIPCCNQQLFFRVV
ncbi:MAG: MFS transporter [Clostridiales bacterium]|nr:MFS transporter [Clostridiales bacterium]